MWLAVIVKLHVNVQNVRLQQDMFVVVIEKRTSTNVSCEHSCTTRTDTSVIHQRYNIITSFLRTFFLLFTFFLSSVLSCPLVLTFLFAILFASLVFLSCFFLFFLGGGGFSTPFTFLLFFPSSFLRSTKINHKYFTDPCKDKKCVYNSTCVKANDNKGYCICPQCSDEPVEYICATDGKTYNNECEVKRKACMTKSLLKTVHKGKCGKMFLCLYPADHPLIGTAC